MAILLTGVDTAWGEQTVRALIDAGYRVIGVAQDAEKLTTLATQLGAAFWPCVMDVADAASIDAALSGLPEDFADIDCLINDATLALGLNTSADKADWGDWLAMMQRNVVGLACLTHHLLPKMTQSGRGHVIHIGTVAGTHPLPQHHVHGATQAFVRQFALNLRADLAEKGIRVSQIELGLCGDAAGQLSADDVAQTVLWLHQRPAHVNVNRIEVMPTAQTFASLTWHQIGMQDDGNSAPKKGLFAKLAGYLKG